MCNRDDCDRAFLSNTDWLVQNFVDGHTLDRETLAHYLFLYNGVTCVNLFVEVDCACDVLPYFNIQLLFY